jgi:hypothetical protein
MATDNWTERVQQIRQLASDTLSNAQATIDDYRGDRDAFIRDLIADMLDNETVAPMPGDEMLVGLAELERLVPQIEMVPEGDSCPFCGERRIVFLAIDDTAVECLTCGHHYSIVTGEEVPLA